MPKVRTPIKSRSSRAGLTLPVARVNKYIKENSTINRTGASCPVYMTAVLEYVVGEILEKAGDHTVKEKRKRITTQDISFALRTDKDLSIVSSGVALHSGDCLKRVGQYLLPKEKSAKKKSDDN